MTRPGMRFLVVSLAIAAVAAFGVTEATSTTSSHPVHAAPAGLHVSGNQLLNGQGRPVQFHGVNRSGTEYACIQGAGIFDGPADAQSVRAMASWHINAVRVPINEDCWLDINGVKAQYAGATYRSAVVSYVRLLHRYGMYAELSLIWAAPGRYPATYQAGGPDADHAPAVWAGMARAFRNDPDTVLSPWGETVTDPLCFLSGGVCEATFGPRNEPYRISGMQQAVNVMRRAGFTGVISIPGVAYANDLSKWLRYEPRDPEHQLMAEAHVYGKNVCATSQCFNTTLAPVARRVPLILGETGETYDSSDCGSAYVSRIVSWADAHHVGYEAWAWDTWPTCSALIANYAGTPHAAYGAWIKAHYASVPAPLLDPR